MKNHFPLTCFIALFLLTGCNEEQPKRPEQLEQSKQVQTIINVAVKKSSSGICHDESSASFNRTKNFTPYDSVSACIASGGRLPKGAANDATNEAINEGRDFVSLYNRSDWTHWIDDDGDCQNTRHELLISTSQKPVDFKTDKGCSVLTGSWYDPYSGETYTDSVALDLDHVVPLKFAHGRGGDKWPRAIKQEFANDLENLLLVQASLNRKKGAKGLDEWLPPNHQYRCEYIAHFNKVMDKYKLAFIPSEQRIVDKMVSACQNSYK